MRRQGLDSQAGFDLKQAAEILAKLGWAHHDFLELLGAIRAEAGDTVSLPVLYRRLLGHFSQHK